eukprot:GILK01005807.1.p1 GENE.GILK01005807.1~~GILK01005807.1.p1  ORF type:complete len:154 (-),score=38.94 GILK01005807.1:146-559(-)
MSEQQVVEVVTETTPVAEQASNGDHSEAAIAARSAAITEEERLRQRAERFGFKSDTSKLRARAERFGDVTSPTLVQAEEAAKKAKRASRFGSGAGPSSTLAQEEERRKKRADRFALAGSTQDVEKKKARLERFKQQL